MKIEELMVERSKIQTEMNDEIRFAKAPYLPKIKALDFQIERLALGKEKSDIAKNVRKHKSR